MRERIEEKSGASPSSLVECCSFWLFPLVAAGSFAHLPRPTCFFMHWGQNYCTSISGSILSWMSAWASEDQGWPTNYMPLNTTCLFSDIWYHEWQWHVSGELESEQSALLVKWVSLWNGPLFELPWMTILKGASVLRCALCLLWLVSAVVGMGCTR